MRRNGSSWARALIALALCVIAGLAGCGASTKAISNNPRASAATSSARLATPTQTLAVATDTPVPTAYPTPISQVVFACPAVSDGTNKTFTDSATGFSFSYPASWTETQCQRTVQGDGTVDLNIGQVFNVAVIPRTGMDAAAWVQTQVTVGTGETATTTPITVKQAMEAYQITDNIGPTTPDNRPLLQAGFIIMGSRSLYVIYTLIAQTNMQDTLINVPPLQIVQTVSVKTD
ncbi:MAG TPA: hypothetical protein VJN88_11905 [Ktedonobacterales bacterium]|nr:hypothetical protein [Ktedonobacterales bacterium]